MTDEEHIKEAEQQEGQSVIIIEFARPGDAEPANVKCLRVTAGQIHAAARRLTLMADRHVHQQWQMQAMSDARRQQEMAQVQQMLKTKKAN